MWWSGEIMSMGRWEIRSVRQHILLLSCGNFQRRIFWEYLQGITHLEWFFANSLATAARRNDYLKRWVRYYENVGFGYRRIYSLIRLYVLQMLIHKRRIPYLSARVNNALMAFQIVRLILRMSMFLSLRNSITLRMTKLFGILYSIRNHQHFWWY
jgi:hypothetical protein